MLLSFSCSTALGVEYHINSTGADGEKESRFLRSMLLMGLLLEYCMATLFGFMTLLPPRWITVFVLAELLAVAAIVVVSESRADRVAGVCGDGKWRRHLAGKLLPEIARRMNAGNGGFSISIRTTRPCGSKSGSALAGRSISATRAHGFVLRRDHALCSGSAVIVNSACKVN